MMTSTSSTSRTSVVSFTLICAANDAAAAAAAAILPFLLTDLGIGFWAPVVVGDFTREHSYEFLKHLLPAHSIIKSDWEKVYKVRGGPNAQGSDGWLGWHLHLLPAPFTLRLAAYVALCMTAWHETTVLDLHTSCS